MDGAPCKRNAVVKVEGMDDVGAPVVHVRRPFVDLVKGHPLFHFLHDLVLAQNCRHLKPNTNCQKSHKKGFFLKNAHGVISPPVVRTCTYKCLSILYRKRTSKYAVRMTKYIVRTCTSINFVRKCTYRYKHFNAHLYASSLHDEREACQMSMVLCFGSESACSNVSKVAIAFWYDASPDWGRTF